MREKLLKTLTETKIIGYTPFAGAMTEYSSLNEEEAENIINILACCLSDTYSGDEQIADLLNDLED